MLSREVIPLKQGLDFKLNLPGSKSITNRAFLCAALAKGKSVLRGCLESDDTKVMMAALRQVGVSFEQKGDFIEVVGIGGDFKVGDCTFDLHNAGTATRFLTAAMCVREGSTIITGDPRMKERPIGDLVEGLKQLGVEIEYLENDGYPPLKILAKGSVLEGGRYLIRMKGDKSSQYFSAILMMAPLLDQPLKLEVIGDLVSKPYVDITLRVMQSFGVEVRNNNYQSFLIEPQKYMAVNYNIEGDASAASYFQSINFLHGGSLEFENLDIESSIQGDSKYLEYLKKLAHHSSLTTHRSLNMNNVPDVAMTLAVTAPFFQGDTKITGLSTLKIKETDRLVALETELRKLGIQVKADDESIVVSGDSSLITHHSSLINTYNDHRMAMCFAVMGTKMPGVVINNPSCTDKTYPHFFEDLEKIYLSKKVDLTGKNLVLTGMRGSGKTYYGKKIAQMLSRPFIDLDELIEAKAQMPISELVSSKGWDYFRQLESEVIEEVTSAKGVNVVIATGGGVVLSENNMNHLKREGVNVFIFCDPSVLSDRLSKSAGDRPSLTGKKVSDEIQEVWEKRRHLYLKYADYTWDDTGLILETLTSDQFIV